MSRSAAQLAAIAKQKRGAKGTNLGGEFIGPKSIARYILDLIKPGHSRSDKPEPDMRRGVGRTVTRGGSVASLSLPPRHVRADDRIHDSGDHRRMGTVAWVHGDQMRVNWDDGTHDVRPVETIHDPLQDPRRSFDAEPRDRAPKLDAAVGGPGRADTPSGRMHDLIASGAVTGDERRSALDVVRAARGDDLSADQARAIARGGPAGGVKKPKEPRQTYTAELRAAAGTPEGTPQKVGPTAREVEVENRVRAVYDRTPKLPGGGVAIADLRRSLGDDVPRAEVDAALIRMGRAPKVSLMPNEDQGRLTAADRAAAVAMPNGGSPGHFLLIEDGNAPTPEPEEFSADQARAFLRGGPAGGVERPKSPHQTHTAALDSGVVPSHMEPSPAVAKSEVQLGDTAVWEPSGEDPVRGRVIQVGQRTFVEWTGASGLTRRELLTQVKRDADVRFEAGPDRPSPAVAKVARAKAAFDVQGVSARLDSASSKDEARAALQGLTVPQLKELAAHRDLGVTGTKQQHIDAIVQHTTGGRLAHEIVAGSGAPSTSRAAAKVAKAAPAGTHAEVLGELEASLRAIPMGRRKDSMGGLSPADTVARYREKLDSGEMRPDQVDGLLQRLLFQQSDAGGPVDPFTANKLRQAGREHEMKDPRLAAVIHDAIDSVRELRGSKRSPAAAKVAKAAPVKRAAPKALSPTQRTALVDVHLMSQSGRADARLFSGRREVAVSALEERGLLRRVGDNLEVTDAGRAAIDSSRPADLSALAASIRRSTSEDAIQAEISKLDPASLRRLADEMNIRIPSAARGGPAMRLFLAQSVAAHARRTTGGY